MESQDFKLEKIKGKYVILEVLKTLDQRRIFEFLNSLNKSSAKYFLTNYRLIRNQCWWEKDYSKRAEIDVSYLLDCQISNTKIDLGLIIFKNLNYLEEVLYLQMRGVLFKSYRIEFGKAIEEASMDTLQKFFSFNKIQ